MSDTERFVADMDDAGFDTEHYHGRFFWRGPAVRASESNGPTFQEVMGATKVRLQWDSLGFDKIVYPVSSESPDRCEAGAS